MSTNKKEYQNEYVKAWRKKNPLKYFSVSLSVKDFDHLKKLLNDNNLSNAEFLRLSIKKLEKGEYKNERD